LVWHERLVAGELEVSTLLAETLLPYLIKRIHAAFPYTDPQLISDASTDALVEYLKNPRRFDASRGVSIQAFLFRAACNNLRDFLQSEIRRKRREKIASETLLEKYVELHPSEAHVEEKVHSVWTRLESVVSDPLDREVLKLWLEGEWRTEAFAQLMGIWGRPLEEQRRLVKQAKDRLIKMIQRKWRKFRTLNNK
jgi:DNA-directed RNA polymerase specialized sigma24 family protein